MKKLIIPALCLMFMACNNKEGNNAANRESNVENNSGENISPQLENQGDDRLQVDTISNTNEAKQQADDDNLNK